MATLYKAIQKAGPARKEAVYEKVTRYYDIAGPDYEAWSSQFNMHFGYCRRLTDIFFLEKMLNNMNRKVLEQLHLDNNTSVIADLGCGVGTVARFAAKKYHGAHITGITISSYQVQKGNELITREGLSGKVKLIQANFENSNLPSSHFTHAYAVESCCHAHHSDKSLFISEMARVLKQGGRFCIADGFIKHSGERPALFNRIYNKILGYWALPSFAALPLFVACLQRNGLQKIHVREISLRIAPSVAWVPWTCLKFFAKELWKHKSLHMEKERWHNVYGPLLGMFLGLYQKHFGYYIISGEKG